ncbi:MAG: MlaD family protein, partial [Leucobacter sp.]
MTIGTIGVTAVAVVAVGALQYHRLPFMNTDKQYSAYFAESSGLSSGAAVQVSGFRVGEVTDVRLDGPRVVVTFQVDKDIRIGNRT